MKILEFSLDIMFEKAWAEMEEKNWDFPIRWVENP